MMLVTSTNFLRKLLAASMSGCSVKSISGYTPKNSWGEDLDKTKPFTFFSAILWEASIFKLVMNDKSSNLFLLELTEGPNCS